MRIAWDRKETDACQRNTPGCCVDHAQNGAEEECQSW